MMPKGKLGRGKVFEGWQSPSCAFKSYRKEGQTRRIQSDSERWVFVETTWAESGVQIVSYRWRGYACWQWCSWPHWWRHTPILRGPPCWATETVSCHSVGCCAYSCLASPPSMDTEDTVKKCGKKIPNLFLSCVSVCCTFLQVMVGISGSPEAAQGITNSLPASWRYSPPGLTLK